MFPPCCAAGWEFLMPHRHNEIPSVSYSEAVFATGLCCRNGYSFLMLKSMYHQRRLLQQKWTCNTSLPDAFTSPWILPRAKNMLSPACFCTSARTGAALSNPSSSSANEKDHTQRCGLSLAILNLMYIIVLVCGDYSTEKLCTCNAIWPFLFQKAVCFAFELNIYHCLLI